MLSSKKRYIRNCTGAHVRNGGKTGKNEAMGRLLSKLVFYVLLAAFFAVTGHVLFFSSYLQVSKIVISGNEELSSAEIRGVIENRQQGNFLRFFAKDNFLLVSDKEMENSLLARFKKIKQVSVTKKFPDTLEINLQERKTLFILCSGDRCFLIDENGAAYSKADFNSPELTQNHLIKISDKSSADIKMGDVVMNQDYIGYVSTLKDALSRKLELAIGDEFWTPSLMADEVDVKVVDGAELYFSTQFSLETAIRTLDVILKKELAKVQKSDIAYIDLRTESKVFYKLSGNPQASGENERVDNKK